MLNGSTKLVGLIGNPISHSVSPQMHNAAFRALGLNFCYLPFPVDRKEDLKKALDGIRSFGFVGANVTIPYKEDVVTLLDEVTKLPRLIGAVNTILNENGKLIGYNTDGGGFVDSLEKDAGIDPKNKKIVLIGAGGGAKAVSFALAEKDAQALTILDVVPEKAENLAACIDSNFDTKAIALPISSKDLQAYIKDCDILVNATPIGMHPRIDVCPLPEDIFIPKGILVCDLIYNPVQSKLLKLAQAAGAKTLNGLGMLVRQGAIAFSIFTGKTAPIDVMKTAALEALKLS